jgi:hypothetical protein
MGIGMSQQLRAQSISIQASTRTKCISQCKGCIAASTQNAGLPSGELNVISGNQVWPTNFRHLKKGLRFAERCGATHAIITGKAEPLQETPPYIFSLIEHCAAHMPVVDLHTNGWLLTGSKPKYQLDHLEDAGLTMLTLSVSHHDLKTNRKFMGRGAGNLGALIESARSIGLLVRVSLLLHTEGVQDVDGLMEYVKFFGDIGVHMVVVRELWTPYSFTKDCPAPLAWSHFHKVPIRPIEADVEQFAVSGLFHESTGLTVSLRDPLPWGQQVYSVGSFDDPNKGVNLTFARCDEATTGNLIKSIVHRPDGHGYRNWDSNGDILY